MFVQAACQSNTKLVTRFINTPATARSQALTDAAALRIIALGQSILEGFQLPALMLDPLEPEDLVAVTIDRCTPLLLLW